MALLRRHFGRLIERVASCTVLRGVAAIAVVASLTTVDGCAPRSGSGSVAGAATTTTRGRSPTPGGQVLWFDRDPHEGYEWSFFVYLPAGVLPGANAPLLVMPNNTGNVDDRPGVHRSAALQQAFSWRSYAEKLHAAIMVPAFPRPAARPDLYTHALDRDTLRVDQGDLRRLDLQLVGMVRAAQRFLGSPEGAKVLLFGFSAGGMFANRFTLLHPELVLAAAIGSPGGWPMAPLATWKSERLRYPLGSDDLATLTGAPLDGDAARAVRFFFFLGAKDENDSLPFRDGYDESDEALATRLFGRTPVQRWGVAAEIYRAAGMNATFKLYGDVGHDVTDAMDADVVTFFAEAITTSKKKRIGAGARRRVP